MNSNLYNITNLLDMCLREQYSIIYVDNYLRERNIIDNIDQGTYVNGVIRMNYLREPPSWMPTWTAL